MLDLVRELIELTTGGRADRYRALFLPELTRLCTAANALDLARKLAAGLSVDLGRVGVARVAADAVLAEAEARTPEAVALYEQAARAGASSVAFPGSATLSSARVGA